MNAYSDVLKDLQSAMLKSKPELALSLLKQERPALKERLNIYISGYYTRLEQAVLSDYPTLNFYLGDKIMKQLVQAYTKCTPSIAYSLDDYPISFAQYVTKNSNNSFAKSLAILESAIAEVFWLADSDFFVPDINLNAEQLMQLCFKPRAASKLIYLEYEVESYMLAVRNKKTTKPGKKLPHYMLVLRHNNAVQRHVLGDIEQLIVAELFTGKPVNEVLTKITEENPEFIQAIEQNLQNWFAKWVQNGFFQVAK